jgi:hypothetical protein
MRIIPNEPVTLSSAALASCTMNLSPCSRSFETSQPGLLSPRTAVVSARIRSTDLRHFGRSKPHSSSHRSAGLQHGVVE